MNVLNHFSLLRLIALLSLLLLAACGDDDNANTASEPTTSTTMATTMATTTDDPPATEVAVDDALVQRGIDIYLANYCGSCHALEAANTRGNFGPPHHAAALLAAENFNAANYAGEATSVAGYIRESILAPEVYYTPGYAASNHRMPAFVNLSDEEIDALVYMLMQQNTPPQADAAVSATEEVG